MIAVRLKNNEQISRLCDVKDTLLFSDFLSVCVNHCFTLPQSFLACQWVHGECQPNPPDATEEFVALTTSSTAGSLPELMAFLRQLYFLVTMWPRLIPRLIVALIRKLVHCSVSFDVNITRETIFRSLGMLCNQSLDIHFEYCKLDVKTNVNIAVSTAHIATLCCLH